MGSFRGGKRGGSRTAHLKAAAADAGPAEADLPATTWRTSRPRSRQQAVNRAPSSRQSPAQVEQSTDHGERPAEDADEEVEPVKDDDDEVEEGEDEEVEEDEQMAVAGSMHAEESGELMFEAEVVDALAQLPSSRPEGYCSSQ